MRSIIVRAPTIFVGRFAIALQWNISITSSILPVDGTIYCQGSSTGYLASTLFAFERSIQKTQVDTPPAASLSVNDISTRWNSNIRIFAPLVKPELDLWKLVESNPGFGTRIFDLPFTAPKSQRRQKQGMSFYVGRQLGGNKTRIWKRSLRIEREWRDIIWNLVYKWIGGGTGYLKTPFVHGVRNWLYPEKERVTEWHWIYWYGVQFQLMLNEL